MDWAAWPPKMTLPGGKRSPKLKAPGLWEKFLRAPQVTEKVAAI